MSPSRRGSNQILARRRTHLRQALAERHADGMLVTHRPHVRYLSGFTGSAGLLLFLPDSQHFISDGRYREQVRREVVDFQVYIASDDTPDYDKVGPAALLAEQNLLNRPLSIAFEADHVPVSRFNAWRELFPEVQWRETSQVVERLAVVKGREELALLEEAVRITDLVFEEILNDLRPGAGEREIAARIGYLLRRHGADGESFETIVAGGRRSALPHARPTDQALEPGDLVVLDFGARCGGYHADMTRTVCLAPATERHQEVYRVVSEAQRRGIAAAVAGVSAAQVDAACRDYIAGAGYGEYFPHATGHGVGLEVHTAPRLSSTGTAILEAGMVVTIEPGIYLPEWGGVRIEDDVLVGPDAGTPLNRSTKDFLVL